MSIEQAVQLAVQGKNVPEELMYECIADILKGTAPVTQTYDLLVHLARKGETVEELTGAARALRATMVRIETKHETVLDTCGTGGDGTQTFNISTVAAIVCAAAGVPVAKHGNRKITSSTGSADVLAELGVNLDAAPEVVERCLNEIGLCFCFAPLFHPAMKNVATIRRQIPHPTIFNRLGPLANPASATHQVLGVGSEDLQWKLARTLAGLGTQRSLVVRGRDGVDEVSISSDTTVLSVCCDGLVEQQWRVSDFGLRSSPRDALFADGPAASARCIREVLDGQVGAKRDVVLANAAAGLWTTGRADNLMQCTEMAAHAIDTGKAKQLLAELVRLSFT